ncbi:hypothetical protein L1987_60748 [Smallanthus sonchifolius]|uniref:Uncharacterized protein n=1 Tax=Smallanthus sonchifolius TaxID=185202 RepID=A0ACB9D988_9ASTR|nr:hypothetical protein L1987_60748 [Smallanthus sonchifolius]
MLAGILEENGVICEGINFDKGARTALAFVTVKADGDREFMFYRNPSADMLLTPGELNLELIRSAKVFHYGSISLIMEPCRSAHLKAMQHFHGTVGTFPVKAVDTTGAGDSFVGALLTKIVDDQYVLEDEEKLKEVLRYSCACGAITASKKGAIPTLPTALEVETFLHVGVSRFHVFLYSFLYRVWRSLSY